MGGISKPCVGGSNPPGGAKAVGAANGGAGASGALFVVPPRDPSQHRGRCGRTLARWSTPRGAAGREFGCPGWRGRPTSTAVAEPEKPALYLFSFDDEADAARRRAEREAEQEEARRRYVEY